MTRQVRGPRPQVGYLDRHRAALDRLGYDLLGPVEGAAGGFGLVLKVQRRGSRRTFAAKVLHEHLQVHDRAREAFRMEARQCLALKPLPDDVEDARAGNWLLRGYECVNLADSDATDDETGLTYLLLEHVDGQRLLDLVDAEGALQVVQAVVFALQFCHGMRYCRERRPDFVHRDIKPNNAMVTRTARLKIIDFGLSKSVGLSAGLTLEQPGSPPYMAPELLAGGVSADVQTDVYAFGVMLGQIATGEHPDRVRSGFGHVADRPELALPEELVALVERCTHPHRQSRPVDFGEVQSELLAALESLTRDGTRRAFCARCSQCGYIARHAERPCPLCCGGVESVAIEAVANERLQEWLPRGAAATRAEETQASGGRTSPPTCGGLAALSDADFTIVEAGPFIAGCPDGLTAHLRERFHVDTAPLEACRRREVRIPAEYAIGRHAVTNEAYRTFVVATGWPAPTHWSSQGGAPFPPERAKHPVTHVSWHDASAYCAWAGLRLPSDHEWERAARGRDERPYPWGSTFEATRCNTAESGRRGTVPVGELPAGLSPEGLFQASGNTWEWTRPTAVERGGIRGASFRLPGAFFGLCFLRAWTALSGHRDTDIGFRVARPLSPGEEAATMALREHELVPVSSGPFQRGCDASARSVVEGRALHHGYEARSLLARHPAQRLHLPAFAISRFPVTEAEYAVFVDEAGHAPPPHWSRDGRPSRNSELARRPVVGVSLDDAEAFAAWLGHGARLPNADEWERAARGDDGRLHPWGDEFEPARCASAEAGLSAPRPVDANADDLSPWGVVGMAGNVREWVTETASVRGGSFMATGEIYGLTFYSMGAAHDVRNPDVGFRVACDAACWAVSQAKAVEGTK